MDFLTSTAPWQMWGVIAMLALAVIFYMRPRVPIEITSFSILLGLLLLFHFFPLSENQPSISSLLGGFANPALLTIMALLVVGQAMFQSEALEGFTQKLATAPEKAVPFVIAGILLIVFCTTAWLNNTPVAVMFIPVLAGLAARTNAQLERIMMPLSFVCILGGMTTLIGSSTNILAVDIAEGLGAPHFGFFDITAAGLMLAIPGLIYVLFFMPALLPKGDGTAAGANIDVDGRHYIVKFDVGKDSNLVGLVVNKNNALGVDSKSVLHAMRILRVQRGEQSLYPRKEDVELQAGDFLILSATRDVLTQAIKSRHDLFGLNQMENRTLADAVVAPASRFIGRSLSQLTLQFETGCHVLGILHRKRMERSFIQDIRFEAGDVLLVVGAKNDLQTLTNTHDVFLLKWLSTALPHYTQSIKAVAIFLVMIGLAAFEIVPLTLAAFGGAAGMILSNVINLRQAVRAFDQRVFFIVASAIGLAVALEAVQAPTYVANATLNLMSASEPLLIFTAMFLLITVATNLLSNNAAAILFMPIMLKIATLLNLSPELAVITVILAANCSFATPMAYQTNLLVMGPGRYQFSDFVKAGVPLIALLCVCYVVMAKTLYGI